MIVYKIFAVHENKMVDSFGRGFFPRYTKNGMLYYSQAIAEKNLNKCNEYKRKSAEFINHNTGSENHMEFQLKTYNLTEI